MLYEKHQNRNVRGPTLSGVWGQSNGKIRICIPYPCRKTSGHFRGAWKWVSLRKTVLELLLNKLNTMSKK